MSEIGDAILEDRVSRALHDRVDGLMGSPTARVGIEARVAVRRRRRMFVSVCTLLLVIAGGVLVAGRRTDVAPRTLDVADQATQDQTDDVAVPGVSPGTAPSDLQTQLDQIFQNFMDRTRPNLPTPYYDSVTRAALVDAMNTYAHCMQRNGVPFPETPPTFGDGYTSAPIIGGPSTSPLSADSPEMQQAIVACAVELRDLHTVTMTANGIDPDHP